jgi:hypothetical protein
MFGSDVSDEVRFSLNRTSRSLTYITSRAGELGPLENTRFQPHYQQARNLDACNQSYVCALKAS